MPVIKQILILMNWKIHRVVSVSGDYAPNLERQFLLPGFDVDQFPFRINPKDNSFFLINVKTNEENILIRGGSGKQSQFFFATEEEEEDRFELNFCISQQND